MLLFWGFEGTLLVIAGYILNAHMYGKIRELHMWRQGPTNTQMKWCSILLFIPGVLFIGCMILVSTSFIISEFKRVFKKEEN